MVEEKRREKMGNPKTKSSKDILITNFEIKSFIKLLTISVLIVSMLSIVGLVSSVSAKEEQPIMATDVYHGSASEFSELQKIAIDKGWSVISFDEPITLKLLVEKKVSLFVTSPIEAGYTDQELEELKAYVVKGGNMIIEFSGGRVYEESPPEARQFTRELSRLFGIDILEKKDNLDGENIVYCSHSYCELTIHVSSDHQLFEGVSKVNIGHTNPFYYLSVESPAVVILSAPKIPSPHNSLIALFENENEGSVMVYSRAMATSDRSAEADNSIFLNNILKWISPPDKKPPVVPKETIIKEVIDPKSYWILGIGIALIIIAIILVVTFIKKSKKLKKG